MNTTLQNALRLGVVAAALLSALSAHGRVEDDFATALTGRVGRATDSAGERPNPKSSQPAGAPDCLVKITRATGRTVGDRIEMEVVYEATYQPADREKARRLVGNASLLVTLRACQPTVLTWRRLSEPAEAPKEARILVERALQNAALQVF
jgi:hypothetical protein